MIPCDESSTWNAHHVLYTHDGIWCVHINMTWSPIDMPFEWCLLLSLFLSFDFQLNSFKCYLKFTGWTVWAQSEIDYTAAVNTVCFRIQVRVWIISKKCWLKKKSNAQCPLKAFPFALYDVFSSFSRISFLTNSCVWFCFYFSSQSMDHSRTYH